MPLNILKQPEMELVWDYDRIENDDDRDAVIEAALDIKPRLKRTAEDIVAIGDNLIRIKGKLPHGSFMEWMDTELALPYHTAKRFMDIAERLRHKMDNLQTLQPSVLYLLAQSSTPDDVIEEVEQRTVEGERVTVADVQRMKQGKATIDQLVELVWRYCKEGLGAMPDKDWATALEYFETVNEWIYDTGTDYHSVDLRTAISEVQAELRGGKFVSLDETVRSVQLVLNKHHNTDLQRLRALDHLTIDDLAPTLNPGYAINADNFPLAVNRVRTQLEDRLAAEQRRKALKGAGSRNGASPQPSGLPDPDRPIPEGGRIWLIEHITDALSLLPEHSQDMFYEVTGFQPNYLFEARSALERALAVVEKTVEG